MDLFLVIYVIIVGVATLFYLFWVGNKGIWGQLAARFPAKKTPEDLNKKNQKIESVSLIVHQKWRGDGWNIVLITLNESYICLSPSGILKYFVPTVFIPWSQVDEVRECKFFLQKKTELLIHNMDISVLLPYHYLALTKGKLAKQSNGNAKTPFS